MQARRSTQQEILMETRQQAATSQITPVHSNQDTPHLSTAAALVMAPELLSVPTSPSNRPWRGLIRFARICGADGETSASCGRSPCGCARRQHRASSDSRCSSKGTWSKPQPQRNEDDDDDDDEQNQKFNCARFLRVGRAPSRGRSAGRVFDGDDEWACRPPPQPAPKFPTSSKKTPGFKSGPLCSKEATQVTQQFSRLEAEAEATRRLAPLVQPAADKVKALKTVDSLDGDKRRDNDQNTATAAADDSATKNRPASQPTSMARSQQQPSLIASNIKRLLVKRQQSVDSYRMARDMTKKKQQRDGAGGANAKVASSDAVASVGANVTATLNRKLSMRARAPLVGRPAAPEASLRRIGCNTTTQQNQSKNPKDETQTQQRPQTLALNAGLGTGNFAGSITPTYLSTTKLASAETATSEATTTCNRPSVASSSSLLAATSDDDESGVASCAVSGAVSSAVSPASNFKQSSLVMSPVQNQQHSSSSSTSLTAASSEQPTSGAVSKLRAPVPSSRPGSVPASSSSSPAAAASVALASIAQATTTLRTAAAAVEAARRAKLAEHIYDNKCGLGDDMKFLASLPELCDITFLVGETREPVCAVKSVLAARSRVFHKILFGGRVRALAGGGGINGGDVGGPSNATDALASKEGNSPKSRSSLSPQPPKSAAGWSVVIEDGSATVGGAQTIEHNQKTTAKRNAPLVIGPGQTATPATGANVGGVGASIGSGKRQKVRRGDSTRIGRIFSKRASDPQMREQHAKLHRQQALNLAHANQTYVDKMSKSQTSTTMIIEEFEPDVFRQLIEYIHTGCVLLQARTLLGLLNAADYYGLEQLRKACLRFVSGCITVDTVCSLLSTAERYIQYKCTKTILQKVLEFVDTNANEVFKLNAFGLLPEHVVRLILARDSLQADELVKYNGVYTWCEHYCRQYELASMQDVMLNFLDFIQLHKIPANILVTEIYPTRVVPDAIFMRALAYQADPGSFEPPPTRLRRMTLPNLGRDNRAKGAAGAQAGELSAANSGAGTAAGARPHSGASQAASPAPRAAKLRKGSLAQVSLSSVKKQLSSKLSIKAKSPRPSTTIADAGSPRNPNNHNNHTALPVQKDPMLVGRQVVDLILAQRQRELRAAATLAGDSTGANDSDTMQEEAQIPAANNSKPDKQDEKTGATVRARKSLRDFRQISRMFTRNHSSQSSTSKDQSQLARA